MTDYFSRLPESLTHYILSLLPFKEVGRTCVLSKHWNSIWCNYPNLDFCLVDLKYWSSEKPKEPVFNYLKDSLDQFIARRPFIDQLRLRINSCTKANVLRAKLDRWLRLSVDKNVSRIVLRTDHLTPLCSVPQQVFIAQTLQVLDLSWCTLNEDRIVHIDLPRLERLSLSNCWILGDKLLQKIVRGSPNNKHIAITSCQGLKLSCPLSVPRLDLIAGRLEVLDLSEFTLEEDRFAGIEFPCMVKVFFMDCCFVGDNLLQKILCACGPNTIHISVSWCKGVGPSLSVSGKPRLKGFFLRCEDEFERIKIDAPSLRTFSYESKNHNAACVIDLTCCENLENLYGGHPVILPEIIEESID